MGADCAFPARRAEFQNGGIAPGSFRKEGASWISWERPIC